MNFQPRMSVSSQSIQSEKNHRLQGIMVPSSSAFGSCTEVVMGNRPRGVVEVELVLLEGGEVTGPGEKVVTTPSDRVIVVA